DAAAHALTRLNFFLLTRSRPSVQTSRGQPAANCLLLGAAVRGGEPTNCFPSPTPEPRPGSYRIRRFVPLSQRFAGVRWILVSALTFDSVGSWVYSCCDEGSPCGNRDQEVNFR